MKRKMYYVTMILTAGLLLFSTNTVKASLPDDDDPVTEKDKHHGDDGYPIMIQSLMNHTTGILTVTFLEGINDISILLYKDGTLVDSEEEGDVFANDSFFFILSSYGQGNYLVVVKSENTIIYTMSHNY
ncbi:MAG: hypothetical protein J6Z18_00385 [Prevotella sp.]|nr:hypothetical protein [Prevotella sp.]